MTVDLPAVAAHLAAQHGSNWIIQVGVADERLRAYAGEFFVAAVAGPTDSAQLTDDQVRHAIVVCPDLDGSAERVLLLAELGRLRERAAAVVVATGGADTAGFAASLAAAGLQPAFVGRTRTDATTDAKDTLIAIVEGAATPALEAAPEDFRVLAILTGFNEGDVLPFAVRRLLADGIEVLYVDNWSTDGSLDALHAEFGDTIRTMHYPDAPPDKVEWLDLLNNTERQGLASGADWIVHYDPDEIRESPWPGVGLRDGLWNVQRRGFNVVNFHVLVYRPTVADVIPPEVDPTTVLTHWDHLRRPSALVQLKAWRNTGDPVGLGVSGGHEVTFPGRRVFPYEFLLRHYPLRSPAHARRKVFSERRSRWAAVETEQRKWHVQYDHLNETDEFVWDPAGLHQWDADAFAVDCLTERLFGIGVHGGVEPALPPVVANPPGPMRAELARATAALRAAEIRVAACQEQRAADRRKLVNARKRTAAAQRVAAELTGSPWWQGTAPLRVAASRLKRFVARARRVRPRTSIGSR